MKRAFADSLRCVRCSGPLTLAVLEEDEREVREGALRCGRCARTFAVHRGIADFLDPADEALASEIRGWGELAGPLHEGLVPIMTGLPAFPHPPWPHVAADFFQIFEHVDFAAKRVVDLGAGRTWSTRYLMTMGRAREAVAVDVMTARFLGLETADIFFELDGIHFERLRGDVHHLPLPNAWADVAFSCAAVHHSSDLDALFGEVHRVLRPGGRLVFVSEACRRESIPGNRPDNIETQAGINEHVYTLFEYEEALGRAGFRSRRLLPRTVRYRLLYPDVDFEQGMPPGIRRLARSASGRALIDLLLRRRLGNRWLYRHWGLPLSVIAEKTS